MKNQLVFPRGILLDLDNTLYEYKPCHKAALRSAWGLVSKHIEIDFDRFERSYENSRREINRELSGSASSHNRLLYFQRIIEKHNVGIGTQLMLELYNDYWESFIKKIQLFEGVIDFLEHCRKMEIKVALVTDLTADVQLKKVVKLGLSGYIDALVTSEEARAEKPLSPIFRLALKKIGLHPEDVWVIGDNIEKDIVGGNLLGAATIHFAFDGNTATGDDGRKKASRTVNSFSEIIGILNKVSHLGE